MMQISKRSVSLGLLAVQSAFVFSQENSVSKIPRLAQKPNVLFFLVDDLGYQDSSVSFGSQQTEFQLRYRTPNLERLANEGVLFSDAYAAPICSPTRTSIMTGENPARHGVTNWTLYPDKDTSFVYKLLPPKWNINGLQPEDALTLAQVFKNNGYCTYHVGKAHWGVFGSKGGDPLNLGFMVNIAGHAAGGPGSYYAQECYGNNLDGTAKLPWGVPGLEKYYGTKTHLTQALTTEACHLIEKSATENRPFFLYLAHYAVHVPLMSDPNYVQKYLDMGLDPSEAAYASMIEGYDASLGSILDLLDRLNIRDNTLVVFYSDNGGYSLSGRGKSPYGKLNTHNYPLREGKGSAYEGGIRVPLVVSLSKTVTHQFQNRASAGSRCSIPFITEDLFPTLISLASLTIPEEIPQVLDGVDFGPYLLGTNRNFEAAFSNRSLVFHTPNQWTTPGQGKGYYPHSSIRMGDWKAIYFYIDSRWELYNLKDDIGETVNLASKEPEVLKKVASKLISLLEERGACYPLNKKTKAPVTIIAPR